MDSPQVDTLRLMITLRCNLTCHYCCNQLEQVNQQFVYKYWEEIAFDRYKSYAITGGEPFFDKPSLYWILDRLPKDKPFYIYTNGLLMTLRDVEKLAEYPNFGGINISLHRVKDYDEVYWVESYLNTIYRIEDIKYDELIQANPWLNTEGPLRMTKIKQWTMNQCDMPNEDWVVLKPEKDGGLT